MKILPTPFPWRKEIDKSFEGGTRYGISADPPYHWVIPRLNIREADVDMILKTEKMLSIITGCRSALRKALPHLPPDDEALHCGEWIDEINEFLSGIIGADATED